MLDKLAHWYRRSRDTLLEAGRNYSIHRAGRMSAAIAYRTVFALAPLLILAVSILDWIFGTQQEAVAQILVGIEEVAGPELAEFMERFVSSVLDTGEYAAIVGVILLLWTVSSLFLEVQYDLNDIFEVPYERISGLVALARSRGIGVLWGFGLGLVVIAVALLNTLWRFIDNLFPEDLVRVHTLVEVVTPIVSLALLPFLFGLLFQTMTVVTIRWKAVWWGGLFTAIVFVIAAHGAGLYFNLFGTPTAIGFASTFVVILFLAYFLSAVFLFGAEVTRSYSDYLDELESDAGEEETSEYPPGVLVAEPAEPLSRVAMWAFLGGLLVGWRRSKR